jgi:predicted transcriptional regulator
MAERPELPGLATEIVSAHVRNNAIAADQLPGLIQRVFNALATVEQVTAAPPKAEPSVAGEEVSVGGSYRLSRLRQAFLNAAAASDDRP